MSEIIENPFKDAWENFDLNKFKDHVLALVDKIYSSESEDADLSERLQELDELMMNLVIVVRMKDAGSIEVIRLDSLPGELLEELGLEKEDLQNGFIPKNVLPPELLEKIGEAAKSVHRKERKNRWFEE